MQLSPSLLCNFLWELGLEKSAPKYAAILVTAIAVSDKLSFLSDPGVPGLLQHP